jgi:hypothetical protein
MDSISNNLNREESTENSSDLTDHESPQITKKPGENGGKSATVALLGLSLAQR